MRIAHRLSIRIFTLIALASLVALIDGAGLRLLHPHTALAFPQAAAPDDGPVPRNASARIGKGEISGVLISPDERRIAVSTSIGLYMYDAATMRQLWYRENYDAFSPRIAFSNDSTRLISGNGESEAIIRSVETGATIRRF